MTSVRHITWKRDPMKYRRIQDAQNTDDWPDNHLHEVTVDPGEITVEGTPQGIRWLYDWLHWSKRAWRAEGEQYEADVSERMAETIWEAVDGDLPERQRNRRMV